MSLWKQSKNNRACFKDGGKHHFFTESGNKGIEKRITTKEQHKFVGLKSVRVKNEMSWKKKGA